MGKHTAHGYLVEDVYKEAEKFTKVFGFKPARIDETFAGFPMEGKVEFFLWQWKHLEDNLGKDVMAKVKYRDQQAIRCDTPEEVDEAYEQIMSGMPDVYIFWMRQDICGKYIVGQAQCR